MSPNRHGRVDLLPHPLVKDVDVAFGGGNCQKQLPSRDPVRVG